MEDADSGQDFTANFVIETVGNVFADISLEEDSFHLLIRNWNKYQW